MDRTTARRLLGVPVDADRSAIEAAFRTRARSVHPDAGGDAARFDRLVRARASLLEPARRPPPVTVVPDPSWTERLRAALRPLRPGRPRQRPDRPRRVI